MNFSKKLFMLKKLARDIFLNRNISICDDNKSEKLGYYYIRFSSKRKKLNRMISGFDDNGIPLNSSYIDVEERKEYYYPISIGQYGLAVFNDYITKKTKEDLDLFFRIADWFVSNYSLENGDVFYLSDMPRAEYGLYRKWKSAFAQSRAISILLRAWQLSGDKKYLELATQALTPFAKDISEGGLSVDRAKGEGNCFYEEYVADLPTRILDGHIFSMLGLYDYIRAVTLEDYKEHRLFAEKLFQDGYEGLLKILPEYDMGFWLYFGKCDIPNYPNYDPCTIGYMRLIKTQLTILYGINANKNLLKYIHKIKSYIKPWNFIRMLVYKYKALKHLNRL